MFELTSQPATLNSVNPRSELHGDDREPAVDLGITFDAANDLLSEFGPQLRQSLYSKKSGPTPAAQGELDVVAPVSDLPHLRNPCIEGAIKIRFEGVGYSASIAWGIDDDSAISLEGCKVNALKITPKEGGTVSVALRVQVSHPETDDLGLLCGMIGSDIVLTLTAPRSDQGRLAA